MTLPTNRIKDEEERTNEWHLRQLHSKQHVAQDELRYLRKMVLEMENYIEDITYSIEEMKNAK